MTLVDLIVDGITFDVVDCEIFSVTSVVVVFVVVLVVCLTCPAVLGGPRVIDGVANVEVVEMLLLGVVVVGFKVDTVVLPQTGLVNVVGPTVDEGFKVVLVVVLAGFVVASVTVRFVVVEGDEGGEEVVVEDEVGETGVKVFHGTQFVTKVVVVQDVDDSVDVDSIGQGHADENVLQVVGVVVLEECGLLVSCCLQLFTPSVFQLGHGHTVRYVAVDGKLTHSGMVSVVLVVLVHAVGHVVVGLNVPPFQPLGAIVVPISFPVVRPKSCRIKSMKDVDVANGGRTVVVKKPLILSNSFVVPCLFSWAWECLKTHVPLRQNAGFKDGS